MNLYNLIFLVLIGGAAALGFFYLDGPEAVQEYLGDEANSSQPAVDLAEPTPIAQTGLTSNCYAYVSGDVVHVEPSVMPGGCHPHEFPLSEFCAEVRRALTAPREPYEPPSTGLMGESYPISFVAQDVEALNRMCEEAGDVIAAQQEQEGTDAYPPSVVQNSDTPTTMVQGSQCSQLMLGCDAVVTNTGTWLNVRDAPTTNGAIVGRLEDGMTVLIVGDRVQSDGYRWWQIESAGPAGWAAEGDKDGTAWLIPSFGSPDTQGSASDGPSLADTANEPSYCRDLADTRTELEAEDLWEYVKSQLEYSANGLFLKECSAWGD